MKKAALTWAEFLAVVLYTSPMFMLYNNILRGFRNCGAVKEDVHVWPPPFEGRMYRAGRRFASAIHCLVSAVKKLCVCVYRKHRGLDNLRVAQINRRNNKSSRRRRKHNEKNNKIFKRKIKETKES